MKKFILSIIFPLYIITEKIINLSNYDYPKKTSEENSTYNIVIMGTNDIHGAFFPQKVNINNNIYDYGGLIYMGNYITNLREEWGNRFIWLDSGDQFQGGLESKISYGDIMTDFFNIMEINASTIGNHEWDFKIDFLINRTSKAKFKYICSNIKNITTNNNIFLPNQISTSILNVDKIKIGIIGLTTITTKITNKKNVKDVEFLPYVNVIKEKSSELKKNGTDVIILLLHLGVECEIKKEIKLKLGLYNKDSKFDECRKNDELYELLSKFNDDNKYFDVIVSGHTHETVHQWIKGYPVISNIDQGKYFNLMYLYFNKIGDKYTFLKDKTIIEGPIPVCGKIFENTLKCEIGNLEEIKKWGKLHNFQFHNKIIKKEEKLINLSKAWEEKFEKFNLEILTSTDKIMEHIYFKESILSNFYTDAFKKITGADFVILNSGFFRNKWNEGNITMANLYQMEPFDNELTSIYMNGKEFKKMIKLIQSYEYIFDISPSSGLKQVIKKYDEKKRILLNIKYYDGLIEREIEDNNNYKIATIGYNIPNGEGVFERILKWYKIKNFTNYGDTKKLMSKYLRSIEKIKTDNYIDKNNPRYYFKS
jgi:2',3'-cyclic-nucleotide 2'-phosphodiesterase (5'-nucleotidase family)